MRIFLYAGILFGLIGTGFLISSVFTAKDLIYFSQQAELTVGTVINIETRAESSSSPGSRATIYTDYAMIEFTGKDG